MGNSGRLFPRFLSLTRQDLMVDQHLHTTWTDGRDTPERYVERAASLGLKRLAFTDHVRRASTYCRDYLGRINALKASSPVEILAGFEAKVMGPGGGLDIAPEALEAADLVIASVHSIPAASGPGFDLPGTLDKPSLARAERDLAVAAAEAGGGHLLGHAGGMSLAVFGEFPPSYMEDIVRACSANGFPFEINSRYHGAVLPLVLDLLSRFDPPVSVGSDAHHLDAAGECSRLLLSALFGEETANA
jgi:histidinol phosphatase-like PHP family hydrolase